MAKGKTGFKFPMTLAERIIGILYIPIHAIVVPLILNMINTSSGMDMSEIQLNLVYYLFSFIFILVFMFRFLRSSFSNLFDNFGRSVSYMLLGYLGYYVLSFIVALLLMLVIEGGINPNTESIMSMVKLNKNVMVVVAVLFAPIVEEAMFRGALFGTIRQKSRIAAYIVTAVIFALYHLWSFLISDFSWINVLYLFQYIPASLALCWSYEKSGSVWVPIVIHALINALSITIQLTL